MRRLVWLWVCVLFPAGVCGADAYRGADSNLLAQVRAEFETATESSAVTTALIELLDQQLPRDGAEWPPIFLAYRAVLEGLTGKHSLRPWQKFNRANAGLARFQGLVEANPESIEIRMLRFSFCSQLPDFFDMQTQAESDRKVLIQLLQKRADPMVSEAYVQNSIRWILKNGKPLPAERQQLEALRTGAP